MSAEAGHESVNRRSSSRRSLSETTLPQDYLEKLEEKRKQLDESIHKYIAAKEREYKQFQKELKQQYKLSQGQDAQNDGARHRTLPNGTQDNEQTVSLRAQQISPVDALPLTAETGEVKSLGTDGDGELSVPHDHSAIAGLKDRRASVERDKDFLGLFTPGYLPALNAKDPEQSKRATSAPSVLPVTDGETATSPPDRANSDPLLQGKLKRPLELVAMQRTSSSGSSADSRLASALKSSSHRSKQKRVSLAVGDSIVAPSDSVPTALTHYTTSSHSRKRASLPDQDYPISVKRSSIEDEMVKPRLESSPSKGSSETSANEAIHEREEESPPLSSMVMSSPTSSPRLNSNSSKIDPDGDLFDLEAEDEDMPPAPLDSDDSDNELESDGDITGRSDPVQQSAAPPVGSIEVRYDSTTGLVPEPEDKDEDSAVPYLAFGPSSAVAPTQPGFRRPSVVHDPVYIGANYKAAEQDAVENEVYGSSFNRPTSKGSFTAGSLGESYMAHHAEEMMRSRNARQQGQVKS